MHTNKAIILFLKGAALAMALGPAAGCAGDLTPNPRFHQVCRNMQETQLTPPQESASEEIQGSTGVQIYNNVYLPSVTGDSGSK